MGAVINGVSESADRVVLPEDVVSVLAADARIQRVDLTGSRSRGTATQLSDWDFMVAAAAFEEVRDSLPSLVGPLRPVVAQWDRLSTIWCYMMILAGPAKIDLLFAQRHLSQPPWRVSAATLPRLDDHFWDWALWLGSKQLGGRHELVTAELRKMHTHLLGPLGVPAVPASIGQAVTGYRAARDNWETRLGRRVSRAAETTVLPSLQELTG
jgi:hypothetical protein